MFVVYNRTVFPIELGFCGKLTIAVDGLQPTFACSLDVDMLPIPCESSQYDKYDEKKLMIKWEGYKER